MKTQENVGKAYMLSEVEKQIRKDIPRFMKFNLGCVVLYKGNNRLYEVIQISEKHFWLKSENGHNPIKHKRSDVGCFEIIGHDIMLNDVLEWGLKNKLFNVEFVYKSFRFKPYKDLIHLKDYGRWSLSSPYLKDQSEELINFLYNLIKK